MNEDQAYLYGRYNGLNDAEAAQFVQWCEEHKEHELPLNVALIAFNDEMANAS